MRRARLALLLALCAAPLVAAPDPTPSPPAPESEAAIRQRLDNSIDRALQYLARSQQSDGSWAGENANNPAITSLAIMAFLSAGHVPGEGPYGDNIRKGIEWVLERQGPNGMIATTGSHEMYHHGIATLMLAEVCGMTDNRLGRDCRQKLEKAVEVILKAQRKTGDDRGGWRYHLVGLDGDISVTGWQLMALRAAKNLGCDVPPETINEAVDYIKRCHDVKDGAYRYSPHRRPTVACTGTSILALELCGKDLHHSPEVLKAGSYLLRDENLPRWNSPHFCYGIYYCSQACFQLGNNYWAGFRPRLHKVLFDNQQSNGSWVTTEQYSRKFGPNYATSMAVLSLAVEYRYLPIYQRGEEPAGK